MLTVLKPTEGVAVQALVVPPMTGVVQLIVPLVPALAVTVYCRGALHVVLAPPPSTLQPQVKLLTPLVTVVGKPGLHRFAVGAVGVATACALPH